MILASPPATVLALSLGAALAYAVPALGARHVGSRSAWLMLWLAWALHAAVLALGLLDNGARFGFAQALSVTVWLMVTVYGVESQLMPQLRARWALAGFGSAALVLALLYPGEALPPTNSLLLPLHSALGIASYGLFAAAVAHAWIMTRAEARIRQARDAHTGVPLLTLERLTFRFVGAGFVLLSATLLAGLLFGEQLYGAAHLGWRWDHKRVFALLAWITFAVLLVGHWRFGWRGRRAVRVLYLGAALLLLAYVGSSFVLEVLLGRGVG